MSSFRMDALDHRAVPRLVVRPLARGVSRSLQPVNNECGRLHLFSAIDQPVNIEKLVDPLEVGTPADVELRCDGLPDRTPNAATLSWSFRL